jgi:hypothetical protein
MKELTKEEFYDRSMAFLRSRKIFIDSGVTNRLEIAFGLYQTVCAERERELFLTSQMANRPPRLMDRYERPKCPECGHDMDFIIVPINEEGIKVQLSCSNKELKCDVLNSDKDMDWWRQQLRRK